MGTNYLYNLLTFVSDSFLKSTLYGQQDLMYSLPFQMSIEMNNLNRIKIQKKDGGETITFRFQDNNSVVDIDFALQNALQIQNNLKYSISYKHKDTRQDIHILANRNMLRECLKENINQLNVFLAPPTAAACKLELQNAWIKIILVRGLMIMNVK